MGIIQIFEQKDSFNEWKVVKSVLFCTLGCAYMGNLDLCSVRIVLDKTGMPVNKSEMFQSLNPVVIFMFLTEEDHWCERPISISHSEQAGGMVEGKVLVRL